MKHSISQIFPLNQKEIMFYVQFHDSFRQIKCKGSWSIRFHEFFHQIKKKSCSNIQFHEFFRQIKKKSNFNNQFHEFSVKSNLKKVHLVVVFNFTNFPVKINAKENGDFIFTYFSVKSNAKEIGVFISFEIM